VRDDDGIVLTILAAQVQMMGRPGSAPISRTALLGITRWEMLDLMARHKIESSPETAEEMQQEIDAMRRFVGRS
jgi:hypothetical protein